MAANGGCKDSSQNDDVELEAMRKDSFSWHPCQVSLRSTGLGLTVQYVDENLEETIADKEGVLARVRVRSTPLQGDDCFSIQKGDHVLATHDSRVKGVFYDAMVEKAVQVRHSKRSQCRCSFTIRWLHEAPEGEAHTVPASAIMKLAEKGISRHPTISFFFNLLESSSTSVIDTMPFSTPVDGMDWEMDIDMLLERHLQDINNASDISGKKVTQHFYFGLEVDVEEQSQDRAIGTSLEGTLTPLVSNLLQSTGNEEHHTKVESAASVASFQEEIVGSKSLNPLAARAALASLRSKVPPSTELLAESNMENEDMTHKSSMDKLQDGNECGIFSATGHSSVTYDLSVKIKNAKNDGIVKTLFQFPNDSQIAESSNAPTRAQAKRKGKKVKNTEKETIHSSEVKLTRAQSQRNSRVHESTHITDTKDTQLSSSLVTRRFTRSTVDLAEKTELNGSDAATEVDLSTKSSMRNTRSQQKYSENKKPTISPIGSNNESNAAVEVGLSTNSSTRNTRSQKKCSENKKSIVSPISSNNKANAATEMDLSTNFSTRNTKSQQKCSENKKPIVSPIGSNMSTPSTEIEESLSEKDGSVIKSESWNGDLVEEAQKHNHPKRLTRSATREEAEDSNLQPKLKLQRQNSRQSKESNLSENGTPGNGSLEPELQKIFSSPDAAKITAQSTKGRGRNRETLTPVYTTPKSSESIVISSQGSKKNSATSKKQETRFSPRLKYLPRTRSQGKA